MFQDYALFPHLDVAANVAFGLRSMPAADRPARVASMLELVGLPEIARRFPHELSGGQQQRVALARALAPAPSILLLDEPFSNLDPDLRERLALDLRDILKRHGTTALLVTHDQYEAFALADRVGVMDAGRIEQWDTPYRLYHQPATRLVADFVGLGTLPGGSSTAMATLCTELGNLPIRARTDQAIAGPAPTPATRSPSCCAPMTWFTTTAARCRARWCAFRGAQFLYAAAGQRPMLLAPADITTTPSASASACASTPIIVTFSFGPARRRPPAADSDARPAAPVCRRPARSNAFERDLPAQHDAAIGVRQHRAIIRIDHQRRCRWRMPATMPQISRTISGANPSVARRAR